MTEDVELAYTPSEVNAIMDSIKDKVSKKYFDDQIKRYLHGVYKGYYAEEIDQMFDNLRTELAEKYGLMTADAIRNKVDKYYE